MELVRELVREFLTIEEFAKRFNVSRSLVMIWIRGGKVHPKKFNNTYVFDGDCVQEIRSYLIKKYNLE